LEKKLSIIAKGAGGRPPYDCILIFNILIFQRFYNLSDEQAAYQINDRMSFMRFLGLSIADDIPDSRTVWLFREKLTDLGCVEELFSLFIKVLEKLNLIVTEGKIIDASFVEVPIQRNNKAENTTLKEGNIPESFKENRPLTEKNKKRTIGRNRKYVPAWSIFLVLWKIRCTPCVLKVLESSEQRLLSG
jgi:transposase